MPKITVNNIEVEIEQGDDRRLVADPAAGDNHRITLFRLRTGFLQTIRIALAVAELQRIVRNVRQLGPRVHTLVEDDRQPRISGNPQMIITVLADMQILVQVAMEDHLIAAWAFVPQIFRHIVLVDQRPKLGAHEVRQPVHARNPLDNSRTYS